MQITYTDSIDIANRETLCCFRIRRLLSKRTLLVIQSLVRISPAKESGVGSFIGMSKSSPFKE